METSICVATSPSSSSELTVQAVLDKLLPGDIILLENRWTPLAWLIRLFSRTWWTHAELYCGEGRVIGAHFLGIKKQPIEAMLKSWRRALFLRYAPATENMRAEVVAFAGTHVNDTYDFGHLFLYIWRIMRGTLGKAPMPDDPHKHVCTEFVAFCWHHVGVALGGIYADNVTGRSLAEDKQLDNLFKG